MRKPVFQKSLKNALEGLVWILRNERNFQIEIFSLLINLFLITFLHLNAVDTALILMVCFLVLAAEIFNTCIEKICDLVKFDYDQRIKIIKDLAAGAVLVLSFLAVLIALFIYPKYLF